MGDLPFGYDRADGYGGRPGSLSAAGSVIVTSGWGDGIDNLPLEELDDSPAIERSEQATFTHRYRMPWDKCMDEISSLHRGLVRIDANDDVFVLLSANAQWQKPGIGVLTTVEECKTLDVPPHEIEVTPVELGLNIIKHPRYLWAFLGTGMGSVTEQQNQMVIRLLQDYFENASAAYRDALTKLLKDSMGYNPVSPNPVYSPQPPVPATASPTGYTWPSSAKVIGTDAAKAAALEIIQKYWRGEETPSVYGWQITWSAYYWQPQYLHPGGIVEDPMSQAVPELPSFFWQLADTNDPEGLDGGETIFSDFPWLNPQCYAQDGTFGGPMLISWRREPDQVSFNRTWYRVQRRWIGAPYGHWDTDLYSQLEGPQQASDYRTTA